MSERSQMTQAAAQEQNVEQSVSLAALFTAFLTVSLCGVGGGGGIVWTRRIAAARQPCFLPRLPSVWSSSATCRFSLSCSVWCRSALPSPASKTREHDERPFCPDCAERASCPGIVDQLWRLPDRSAGCPQL